VVPILTNIAATGVDSVVPKVANMWRPNSRTKPLRRLGHRLGKRAEMYAEGCYDAYPPMLAYEVTQDRVVFLAGPWRA
jgi:hypothetical protein